jgi:large subunit ribosomal protein L17
MRHGKTYRKLNRTSSHRRAMLRNLVTSLIEHGRVTTTVARAKELRSVADRMVTLGKRGDLAARRRALGYVRQRDCVQKLFAEIAPGFASRAGGYTRVLKAGHRHGDNAPMAIIEFVERETVAPAEPAAG